MKKTLLWLSIWLQGLCCSGCGQTGPLYLPQAAVSAQSHNAAQSSRAAAIR
jgi:predicted small lipoprotein YifL